MQKRGLPYILTAMIFYKVYGGYMEQGSYSPKLLNSIIEIQAAFSVGRETVLKWIDMGAPICVEKNGNGRRYSCELLELHRWRMKNQTEN